MVQPGDYIYGRQDEFASPIVIEKYNLIFFLVPGVEEQTWIRLFRRMMGYDDWQTSSSLDGLVRLYHYSVSRASKLMTDPGYVRAIFVRDPKERISAAFENENMKNQCCVRSTHKESCWKMLSHFGQFLDLIHGCDQPHWRPQGKRMEPKYFETLNFVGHMDTLQEDANRLLTLIGAWDKYGTEGWSSTTTTSSSSGTSSGIFANRSSHHVTQEGYKFPGMTKCYGEVAVDYFYRSDYSNPKLNLTIVPSAQCHGLSLTY